MAFKKGRRVIASDLDVDQAKKFDELKAWFSVKRNNAVIPKIIEFAYNKLLK